MQFCCEIVFSTVTDFRQGFNQWQCLLLGYTLKNTHCLSNGWLQAFIKSELLNHIDFQFFYFFLIFFLKTTMNSIYQQWSTTGGNCGIVLNQLMVCECYKIVTQIYFLNVMLYKMIMWCVQNMVKSASGSNCVKSLILNINSFKIKYTAFCLCIWSC